MGEDRSNGTTKQRSRSAATTTLSKSRGLRERHPIGQGAVDNPCSVGGCANRGRGNGGGAVLCASHYQKWKKYGTATPPDRRVSPNGLCTIDQCDRPVRSCNSGFCDTHYYRIRRGSPRLACDAPIHPPCKHCGGPLSGNQSVFCSPRCSFRHFQGTSDFKSCIMCGDAFPTNATSVTCSEKCRREATRALHHARRALIRGRTSEVFAPSEIFQRDNWRCQLCGKKTRPYAKLRSPLYPTLDHIIPIAKGGAHSRQNTQCAHLRCNVRKQARIIGQLRLFG